MAFFLCGNGKKRSGVNYVVLSKILIAILIIISGYRVTKDSIHILMEGVPHNIDINKVYETLLAINGVKSIHDLHIWSITSDFPALSCHIVIEPCNLVLLHTNKNILLMHYKN